ncbi:hypothetical protein PR048_007463 [Dryococelus australis]|uniref:DDE-1 domain-containing protein n=1 Tax=Dryococelus australis TaxID=614101 RepID=A0ABQ9HW01_9NEOP|nr:hypothetical protein PR048_007463 [Dryococelus australis]
MYKIIKKMDEKKTQKVEIAQQHGIPKSTLFTILKMREEIIVLKYATAYHVTRSSAKVRQSIQNRVSEWLPLLQNVLSRYQPRDVYNADELGMFYNLIPDRTLAVKEDVCKDTKSSKERLTVLCCNMDGSDKIKPLKSPAHPKLDNLRNTEPVFLPKNTTSKPQPLDQGIIQRVKLKFQEMLVWSMVLKIEIGKDMKKAVQQRNNANCFHHAHFVTPVDEEAAASSEGPDDPPPVDTEPQPGPSTVPPSARLTVTRPRDKETGQQLAPDCTFEEFVTADYDIAVWGTLDCADDVQGQPESSDEEDGKCEAEKPAQVPTMRDLHKAGMSMPQF